MDLGRPISTVIPSLDGAVLGVLARTARLISGRQVHRLAGTGSEAGVRLVLNRLSKTGLVHVHDAGNSLLYSLNRRHLAADAVLQLADLRQRFIAMLSEEIGRWALQPLHASLFGSAARGDGTVESDVDLLLVRSDSQDELDMRWQEQLLMLAELIDARTGNRAQMYDLSAGGLRKHVSTGEPIVDEWRRDAITLIGFDFPALLREIAAVEGQT